MTEKQSDNQGDLKGFELVFSASEVNLARSISDDKHIEDLNNKTYYIEKGSNAETDSSECKDKLDLNSCKNSNELAININKKDDFQNNLISAKEIEIANSIKNHNLSLYGSNEASPLLIHSPCCSYCHKDLNLDEGAVDNILDSNNEFFLCPSPSLNIAECPNQKNETNLQLSSNWHMKKKGTSIPEFNFYTGKIQQSTRCECSSISNQNVSDNYFYKKSIILDVQPGVKNILKHYKRSCSHSWLNTSKENLFQFIKSETSRDSGGGCDPTESENLLQPVSDKISENIENQKPDVESFSINPIPTFLLSKKAASSVNFSASLAQNDLLDNSYCDSVDKKCYCEQSSENNSFCQSFPQLSRILKDGRFDGKTQNRLLLAPDYFKTNSRYQTEPGTSSNETAEKCQTGTGTCPSETHARYQFRSGSCSYEATARYQPGAGLNETNSRYQLGAGSHETISNSWDMPQDVHMIVTNTSHCFFPRIASFSKNGVITNSSSTSSMPVCRICQFAQGSDDMLISPCRCAGTIQFIHQGCLMKWLEVSKNRKGNHAVCELCNYQYNRHKKFKLSHWKLPTCSGLDKILHMVFVFCILIMIVCATVTVYCFKQDRYMKKVNDTDLTQSEIGTLVCGVLFFVAFFMAMYVEVKATDTLYKIFHNFLNLNQIWYIDNYDKQLDTQVEP